MNMKDRFKSVHTRDPKEVLAQQTRILKFTLDHLIIVHEEDRRLKCTQLLVGQLFKDLVDFDKDAFFIDGSNPNFLGGWRGVPVSWSPSIMDICAIALAGDPGFPSTSTEDPGF